MVSSPKLLGIKTNDTVLVAVWVEERSAGVVASLRHPDGEVVPGVYQGAGPALATLLEALQAVADCGAKHCLIVTNSQALAVRLMRPFRWNDAVPPTEWPQAYYDVLGCLTLYCRRGAWRVMTASNLPKARETWQQQR